MRVETNEQCQQNRFKSSDIRKHQLKDKILIAAADLFYHKGFNQVSINEVIVYSYVAKRTVFRYFPSKAQLKFAIFKSSFIY